jgi:hypothetical protein
MWETGKAMKAEELAQSPIGRWLTKRWRGHKLFALHKNGIGETSQCEPGQKDQDSY